MLSAILIVLFIWSTCFMTGLIWFVQIVHYPLFANIPEEGFSAYEEMHQARTSLVVGPVMLVEAVTTAWMWYGSTNVQDTFYSQIGLLLLLIIWLVTAFVSMPAHQKLSKKFDPKVHRWLVTTNWIRTIAWTIRSFLLFFIIFPEV